MLSFEAIDPTKQPDFDAIVNCIVEDAVKERGVVASISGLMRPVLLAAAIAAVIAVPIFTRATAATERPELSEAIGIPHQVAQWARQSHPVDATPLDVLNSFGSEL